MRECILGRILQLFACFALIFSSFCGTIQNVKASTAENNAYAEFFVSATESDSNVQPDVKYNIIMKNRLP